MVQVYTLENAVQAKQQIEQLESQGVSRDHMYIFAEFEEREDDITKALDTASVGVSEQGFLNSLKNVFNSRDEELLTQLTSLGLSETEATDADHALKNGQLVLLVKE